MDLFMKHYPYGSHKDVMELLNRHPNTTGRDMEKLFIDCGPDLARSLRLPNPNILGFVETSIRGISISRETEKQKGREHVIAGPLLHVHSLHVQPKEALKGRPLLVCGMIRVKYQNIITGKEVHLDVYRQSAEEADYISPSGGNLVLFRPDIFPDWITGYQDFWMELQGTSIEVDLYLKIGESTHSFAREKFLVGSTTQGDVEELRSKEFQHTLCSATLSYIKMPFAALCKVDVRFSSKNKDLVVNVSGKIVMRYRNICGNYNSEPCVLFEKENGFVSVKMEELLPRKLLGVPAYSSLEVELDLMDVNTSKPIKEKITMLNEDGPHAGDCVVDVDGDFAIILYVALIPHVQRLSVHKNESDDGWSLSNNANPRT
ncbi:unnamed protein product [Cuscuta campestris]|uniref:DUF6598 domain-containing protein n=1 Tax=Cuscuta campestris TaxID=132261 RepID=A0A484LE75_9ASTE|nr:unnamed protein product [Cuscuta campestris]